MTYRRRCYTCKYSPGGHPWYAGRLPMWRPERKLWCGVGKKLVGRSDGEDCSEWVLVDNPKDYMREY